MKMDKYEISVIIPIYNEEKYIEQCIDSILKNNNCNYEILMVDDGSTDGSVDICKKYQQRDGRCKLIQKENGGSVSARYQGIQRALGEYLTFVDADDWVDDDFLDDAIKYIKKNNEIDIFVWKMVKAIENNIVPIGSYENEYLMQKEKAIEEMFTWNYFRWEMAGKIYRRSLFDDYYPQKEIKIAEDLDSNWILFNKANWVLFSGRRKYYYRENSMSITKTISPVNNDSWKVYSKILCDEYSKTPLIVSILTKRAWESLWNTYRVAYFMDGKENEQLCECIDQIAKKIYRCSDLGVCIIPQIWEQYQSFEGMVKYNVELNLKKLTKLKIRGRVFIYGCGNIATYISMMCEKKDIEVSGYIMTNISSDSNSFFGKTVYSVFEYKECNDDIILLAVSKNKQEEIKESLKKKKNICIINIDCWQ